VILYIQLFDFIKSPAHLPNPQDVIFIADTVLLIYLFIYFRYCFCLLACHRFDDDNDDDDNDNDNDE
jgi:hypothetical protein